MPLVDPDTEPENILCEKKFWLKTFFGTVNIFGGDLEPEPEKV